MIKQKILPLYSKYDIVNSEMPEVFLDPTAKIEIYLYETNQEFNQIFLDENDSNVRIVEFKLHTKMDAWLGQNFTKQINPFQNQSASKTIAFQTEIELYVLKNVRNLIEKKFCFFTFQELTNDNIDEVNRYLIKENVDNFDKLKFRFSKLKAWLLSSTLIKNYQFWIFKKVSEDLGRRKIKQIQITLPPTAGIGNIRIEGNNQLGLNPQEVNYSLQDISHPFLSLEPLAINFKYNNGVLNSQLINWDCFGQSLIEMLNTYWSIGALNNWGTVDFGRYIYGAVAYQAGAIIGPAPTGSQKGLAHFYVDKLRDKPNDLKQYMWGADVHPNLNIKHYYNLKKSQSTSSISFLETFFKQSVATGSFTPWWATEDTGGSDLGPFFYNFSMNVLNGENFSTSNDLLQIEDVAPGNYTWVLAPEINFYDIGIFSKKTGHKPTFTDTEYYNFGTLPWNFLSTNQIQTIFTKLKISDKIQNTKIVINLEQPTFINNISINVIWADDVSLDLLDENGNWLYYSTNTNFYLVGQDQITTKINFF